MKYIRVSRACVLECIITLNGPYSSLQWMLVLWQKASKFMVVLTPDYMSLCVSKMAPTTRNLGVFLPQ